MVTIASVVSFMCARTGLYVDVEKLITSPPQYEINPPCLLCVCIHAQPFRAEYTYVHTTQCLIDCCLAMWCCDTVIT